MISERQRVSTPTPPMGERRRGADQAAHLLFEQLLAGQRVLAQAIERLGSRLNAQEVLPDRSWDQHEGRTGGQATAELASLEAVGPAPLVSVYCLGSFQVLVGGDRIEGWRSGKARALFQYLVNHRKHPVPRERLIEAIWPDPDARAAGTSLKVAVHALRQMLSRVERGQAGPMVVAKESGYQLQAEDIWLDAEEFERCFALGRRLDAQQRGAEALAYYTRAAELYRGDFLEESWDDWVLFRREGLKDQYLFALAQLANGALAMGDYEACILRCQQLLGQDRCREDTYRTLMLCHARLGHPGRVRRWYELCVHALRTEVDAAPDAETEQVYRQAMRGAV